MSRSDENEQKKIIPGKGGKHRIEKDKTKDTTKPPTDPNAKKQG